MSDRTAAPLPSGPAPFAMPPIGLGVFALDDEDTARIVCTAIELGYRSIDTAAVYGNEAAVGEGIRRSGIPRDELFVTTKLWVDAHGVAAAQRAAEQSLGRLGLDRLDLYLIHWPHSAAGRHREAWQGLERIADRGLSTHIGVSNFSPSQVDDIAALGGRLPAVDQIEVHPFHRRSAERSALARRGIRIEAWSPLARGRVFADAALLRLAAGYGVSVARLVLRWHLQHGLAAVVKSSSADRLAENLRVFDFSIAPEHMALIDALDRGEAIEPDYYRLG